MSLRIDKGVYDAMVTAARKAVPLEACGLLAGAVDHATHFYELTNADHSAKHFSLIPEEQFTAVKDIRARKLRMTAVWHSHPATPARMSTEDLRLAYTPDIAYVIVSLAASNPEIRVFRVGTEPRELPLVICHCMVPSPTEHGPSPVAESEQ